MRPAVVITLFAGLAVGVAGAVLTGSEWRHAASGTGRDIASSSGIGHPIYSLDPRKDRELADYATDIFIGRVLDQTGALGAPTSAPGQELPQSQFAVEVMDVIKGEADGVVTVNQIGGLDTQAGETMLLEGDALLRPGAIELFLVVSVPERGWHQIVAAGYGHLPADDPTRREALIDRFAPATVHWEGGAASGSHRQGERT